MNFWILQFSASRVTSSTRAHMPLPVVAGHHDRTQALISIILHPAAAGGPCSRVQGPGRGEGGRPSMITSESRGISGCAQGAGVMERDMWINMRGF